jgi:hypothetical protein
MERVAAYLMSRLSIFYCFSATRIRTHTKTVATTATTIDAGLIVLVVDTDVAVGTVVVVVVVDIGVAIVVDDATNRFHLGLPKNSSILTFLVHAIIHNPVFWIHHMDRWYHVSFLIAS